MQQHTLAIKTTNKVSVLASDYWEKVASMLFSQEKLVISIFKHLLPRLICPHDLCICREQIS